MTSRDRLFSKLTNLVSKPRYEKTRVDELVEDVITYFPSRSVTTPLEVSFSKKLPENCQYLHGPETVALHS